jgi:hypothetical protein
MNNDFLIHPSHPIEQLAEAPMLSKYEDAAQEFLMAYPIGDPTTCWASPSRGSMAMRSRPISRYPTQ